MVTGLERRDATQTNADRSLRSMSTIEPVTLPRGTGPASNPRVPRVNVQEPFAAQVAAGLGSYMQEQLGSAVKKQQKSALMDGAMAAQQGAAMDDVEMGGDKWALEGYKLVTAQRLASSMLTAQRAELAQGGYEADPEEYRAQFMRRADGMLENAGDGRVSELAREQLLKQMPVLVDDHMMQHLSWKEQKNFNELAASVDTISMDPTSADSLISFARGGAGSATAGLADDRRTEAVSSGIIQAFENGNPAAYAILANEGLLDDMPHAQVKSIRAAKAGYETRKRQEFNAEFIAQEDELMTQIASGGLEPQMAIDAYADLLEQHGMEIKQAEAGAVYSSAQQGVRTQRATTGALVDEAEVRGDRDQAISLIIGSLSGTESGGNTAAFRTNVDGRSYGGELQFGAARLKQYSAATGDAVTVDQFKFRSAAGQAAVNRWHVNDILDTISELDPSGALIGSSINGVVVTRAGLAAVAHLGGIGGMRKFVTSNGKYNPSDELGTSLTDYLRKHGTGAALTPGQIRARTDKHITTLRDNTALDAYDAMTPKLDLIDRQFTADGDTAAWQTARAATYAEFGVQRTMAIAKHEMGLLGEARDRAESRLDEQSALVMGATIRAGEQEFQAVLDAHAKGQASQQDVADATKSLRALREDIRTVSGVDLDASGELTALDAQTRAIGKAVDARLQFDQEQVQIDSAVMSGTLDELTPKLQQRAVDAARTRAANDVADAQAVDADADPGALMNSKMVEFYATSGAVDPVMRQAMNGFLSQPMLDAKGEPSAYYMEAVEQYRALHTSNPHNSDAWVDKAHRADLDAILSIAGTGPIAEAVRTIGNRKAGNIRDRSVADIAADPRILEATEDAVSDYMAREDIGVLQALFSRDADLQQVRNTTWFDQYGVQDDINTDTIQSRMTTAVQDEFLRNQHLSADELVSAAARRVQAHTPIIGGTAVPMPMDGPGIGQQLFAGRAGDFMDQAGVVNDVFMDYFRTDAFQDAYPFSTGASIMEHRPEGAWISGVRAHRVRFDKFTGTWSVSFELPNGGSSEDIALDLRTMGTAYMRAHTANAAKKELSAPPTALPLWR